MLIDYHIPENHVRMQGGLPSAIRPTLLEEARSDWQSHPKYAGKASFFMNIHHQLLDGTHQVARALESMLDMPPNELPEAVSQTRLIAGGRNLISFSHHQPERLWCRM